ncbi:MAG: PilZ domain-containing protein [Treponema sp.]|nr:PilZ domain-containing protein [Treponema sp.]
MAAIILVVGIGLTIITVMIINFTRNRVGNGVGSGKSGGITPRKFNGLTLHRIANSYGLDRDQTKLLEYVFRLDAVSDPGRVMGNASLLDKHFKQAYRVIERNAETEEDAQIKLARLFSLRNSIEASQGNENTLSSTKQIADNAAAVLSFGKDNYPVKIISSKADNVLVEYPRTALGTPIHLPRGSKVSLAFFTKSSKGFSFDSRVLGTSETSRGLVLQLAHSNRIKPLVQRRFRRKQTMLICVFFLVFADETTVGRKKVTKLTVDRRRYTGTILDISVGGCSMKTSAAIPVGSRLKITVDYSNDTTINVLGQVLRTNRSNAGGIIMHIKFLKIPRKAMNIINTMVFGFAED